MTDTATNTPILTVDNKTYHVGYDATDKEAMELALHAKYRIDNGSIKIRGTPHKGLIMQKMLREICLSFVSKDQHFMEWLAANEQKLPEPALEKYFLAKIIK